MGILWVYPMGTLYALKLQAAGVLFEPRVFWLGKSKFIDVLLVDGERVVFKIEVVKTMAAAPSIE